VLDGYHAVASHVIDVQTLGVDCYFGGLLKEGCGSSGSCFLYIRPGLDLHPTFSGWIGDQQPFAFSQFPEAHHCVRRRFLTGTPPIASLYHSVEGLKILLQAGMPAVASDIRTKVAAMHRIFLRCGIRVVSPTDPNRLSALIVLGMESANAFRDYIAAHHGILVDARLDAYIRLAPHVYTSMEELERTVAVITSTAKADHYRTFRADRSGPVT
jgi:kynureninase